MINNKTGRQGALIFLHIPKTAGTSLRKVVERFYDKDEIYAIYEEHIKEFKDVPDDKKNKIKVFYGHVSFGLHKYIPQPTSYVTILRDPVERVISLYSYVSKLKDHPYYKQFDFDKMTIAEFVQSGITLEADNEQTRLVSGIDCEFGKCTSEMLETAKENLRKHFAVVGLSEYFDESVLLMKLAFGWKLPIRLSLKKIVSGTASPFYERTNVSINRVRRDELSEDDLFAIDKFNELDIQLYRYAKELFHEQINKYGHSFNTELKKLKEWRENDYK